MKVSAFTAEIRLVRLHDKAGTAARFGDTLMVPWLNSGRLELFKDHPEAFYEAHGGVFYIPPASLAGEDELDISPEWEEVLSDFIMHKAFAFDAEHAANARLSNYYLAKFNAAL